MRSRRKSSDTTRTVILWLVGVLMLSACSREPRLGTSLVGKAPSTLADSGTACLNGGGKILQDFADGKAKPQQIRDLCDCAKKAINKFLDRVRGEKVGSYTAEEIRRFTERYLATDIKISDKLLAEAMELKRIAVGGTVERVTDEELEFTKNLVEAFKHEAIALLPYMPLQPKEVKTRSDEDVDAGLKALEHAAERFGKLLGEREDRILGDDPEAGLYTFTHFDGLLGELATTFDKSEWPKNLRKRLPLIRAVKDALLSPGAELLIGGRRRIDSGSRPKFNASRVLQAADYRSRIENDRRIRSGWREILIPAAQWYNQLLVIAQLTEKKDDISFGENRVRLGKWVGNTAHLLRESVSLHTGGTLDFSNVERITAQLDLKEVKLAGHQLDSWAPLNSAIRVLITRVLGGTDTGSTGRAATGVTASAVDRAENAFAQWDVAQRAIEAMFFPSTANGGAGSAWGGLPTLLDLARDSFVRPADIPLSPEALFVGYNSGSAEAKVANRMMGIVRNQMPLYDLDAGLIMSFRWHWTDREQARKGLSNYSWSHELTRLVMQGYAEDLTRGERLEGLKLSEVTKFYDDFKPFGVAMKIFDQNGKFVPEKRFREGNLFLPSSDDNKELLSFSEAQEEFLVLVSGKNHATEIHSTLASFCRVGPDDVFEKPTFPADCFRGFLQGEMDRNTFRMPELVRALGKMDGRQKLGFGDSLEQLGRVNGVSEERVGIADTEGVSVTLHYLEVIFAKYDLNSDGKIDGPTEGMTLFEHFKPVLKLLLAFEKPSPASSLLPEELKLQLIFCYVLSEGKKPDGDAIAAWAPDHIETMFSFSADRLTVARVLAGLSEYSAKLLFVGRP